MIYLFCGIMILTLGTVGMGMYIEGQCSGHRSAYKNYKQAFAKWDACTRKLESHITYLENGKRHYKKQFSLEQAKARELRNALKILKIKPTPPKKKIMKTIKK